VVDGSLLIEALSLMPPTVAVSVAESELEMLPASESVAESLIEPSVGTVEPLLLAVSEVDWLALWPALAVTPLLSPQAARRTTRAEEEMRLINVRVFIAVSDSRRKRWGRQPRDIMPVKAWMRGSELLGHKLKLR
jgi:hypothetical protein